jgi:hypothetical protein
MGPFDAWQYGLPEALRVEERIVDPLRIERRLTRSTRPPSQESRVTVRGKLAIRVNLTNQGRRRLIYGTLRSLPGLLLVRRDPKLLGIELALETAEHLVVDAPPDAGRGG